MNNGFPFRASASHFLERGVDIFKAIGFIYRRMNLQVSEDFRRFGELPSIRVDKNEIIRLTVPRRQASR